MRSISGPFDHILLFLDSKIVSLLKIRDTLQRKSSTEQRTYLQHPFSNQFDPLHFVRARSASQTLISDEMSRNFIAPPY